MADLVGLTPSGDVVVQQASSSGQGPQTQITGGPSGGFSGFVQPGRAPGGNFREAAEANARTLDALNGLTQGFLKPHIEAAEKKAYFEGMSQVAQGRSLIEVQKDQPWYTQLFGPSATVKGAQAMTMMSAMNSQKAEFMEQMPQLRTQSPDAVRQYLVDNASKLSTTGDPMMDAMIQGKLAENFGPMLDLHMKQHVMYVQEQNNVAYGNALVSSAEGYQKTVQNDWGMLTPEQQAVQKKQQQSMFEPMPGQTEDSWNKTTSQAVQTMLMKGNFAAVAALRESEHWNKLSPAVREQITRMEPYAVQWNQKNNPMYRDSVMQATSLEIAVDQGSAGSWAEVERNMNLKNDQYMKAEGSLTPYYDNNDFAAMRKRWEMGQRRLDAARNAAAKGVEEANDANAQRTYVLDAVNSGSYNPIAQNNLNPDVVQTTLRDVRMDIEADPRVPGGMQTWLRKLAVASEQGNKMVDHELSHVMTVDMNNLFSQGAIVTDAQRKSLDYARMLAASPNGASALAAYVGTENAAKALFLIKSGADLNDKSTMDALRKTVNEGWKAEPTKADIAEVTSYLDKQDPGFIKKHIPIFGPGAVSGYDLNDDSKRNMISALAPQIAAYRRSLNLSLEEATGLAFNHRFGASSNVDFVDGTFVEPGYQPKGQGLFAQVSGKLGGMSQASDDYQLAVRRAIADSMSKELGQSIGKPKELTGLDKTANKAATFANDVISSIPFVGEAGRVFDEKSALRPEPGTFDPDSYKTIAGIQVGAGVLALTRVQKDAAGNQRPVTVFVTPDAVIKQYDAIRKERASRPKEVKQPENLGANSSYDPYNLR